MNETSRLIIFVCASLIGLVIFIRCIAIINRDSTNKDIAILWTTGLLTLVGLVTLGYFGVPWLFDFALGVTGFHVKN